MQAILNVLVDFFWKKISFKPQKHRGRPENATTKNSDYMRSKLHHLTQVKSLFLDLLENQKKLRDLIFWIMSSVLTLMFENLLAFLARQMHLTATMMIPWKASPATPLTCYNFVAPKDP